MATSIRFTDPTLKAVTLDSDEFSSEDAQGDYGVIIKRYKEALRNGGVVLIADLNKVAVIIISFLT